MVCRKSNHGIKKCVVANRHARQDRPEEVVRVSGHAVVVAGDVFNVVIQVKLELVWKKRPVRARAWSKEWAIQRLQARWCEPTSSTCRHGRRRRADIAIV